MQRCLALLKLTALHACWLRKHHLSVPHTLLEVLQVAYR